MSSTAMQALFAAIRKASGSRIWSKGVELSRGEAVVGDREEDDEIVLKVIVAGRPIAPTVSLWPEDVEWSCNCDSGDDPCEHVAAAVISLRKARQAGKDLPPPRRPRRTVVYRFARAEKSQRALLAFERLIVDASGKETPLRQSLGALVVGQRQGQDEIIADEIDLRVDAALGGRVPAFMVEAQMERLLVALVGASGVTIDGVVVNIAEEPAAIIATVDVRREGYFVRVGWAQEGDERFENGAMLIGDTLRPLGVIPLIGEKERELLQGRLFRADDVNELVTRLLPALERRGVTIDVRGGRLPTVTSLPAKGALLLTTVEQRLQVQPVVSYGEPPTAYVVGQRLLSIGQSDALPVRQPAVESQILRKLNQGLELSTQRANQFYGGEAVRFLAALGDRFNGPLLGEGAAAFVEAGRLDPSLASDGEALGLKWSEKGGASAEAATILDAWRRGESHVRLDDGRWSALPQGFLDEHGHWLAELLAAKQDGDRLRPSAKLDLLHLHNLLGQPAPPNLRPLLALLDGGDLDAAALPSDLEAELRGYQREGVNWLALLQRAELGALLADDMGLGKTLQVLCVFKSPCLVVAPASVLTNWGAELARFRPGATCKIYHGANRSLDRDVDLTVTTYAILRRDAERLAEVNWQTVVLDEAQTIRNPESQVARAAFSLDRAPWRVALSGTPVENRLEDLWSIMRFLNPGLLGGRDDFDQRYAKGIGEGRADVAKELNRRLRPFVLRRMKKDVAAELPARTEVALRCQLSDTERAVYDGVRLAAQQDVLENLQAGKGVLAALEALLRLRQACCHPALLPGRADKTSSKLELLAEVLPEAIAVGHKALVFSQWTSLLDLVEARLERDGVEHLRLDGSTKNHGELVERFQADDGPPVFLISLKAGGVGLNLTAADHVFILDPWWNPAAEDQAADRAHRIGQTRPVLIHRLIAEDTVEERIVALQQKKRMLAAAALSGADAGASITRNDIVDLLSD